MPGFRKSQPINEADYIFQGTISSNACAVGDLLELTDGSTTWADCTSTSNHFTFKAIALEAVTTSATEVRLLMVNLHDVYIAETANNSAATDNGDSMVLTDTNTVNNTHTTSAAQVAVVTQLVPVGALANKEILCKFIGLTGLDPDAT